MNCGFFTGNREEMEARLNYQNRKIREAKMEAHGNSHLGFDNPPKLFVKQMYILGSQSYGKRIENYYKERLGLKDVPNSEDRGDSKNSHGAYFEIKTSYKTVVGSYSFIQIRPYQDLVGYVMICIDPDNEYEINFFYLTKLQMSDELRRLGGCAHTGTKLRRMTLSTDSEDWDRWIKYYHVPNEKILKKILTKEPISNEKRVYFGR